jgi:quinol monooxygenase YgiN
MAKITVVATLTARTDAVETVKAELCRLIPPTRAEAGCLEYRLHQDLDEPARFTFYENWEDMACLERHMNSEHFQRYVAAVGHLLTDKVVYRMTEIG